MMGVYMLIVAVITATHPPDSTSTTISSASVASLTMIYLEASKSKKLTRLEYCDLDQNC